MVVLQKGLWIALGAGLLAAQGLKPFEVRAERHGIVEMGAAQMADQGKNPEAKAPAQGIASKGKASAKARRPAPSKNILPSWPFTKPFRYFNPIQNAEPNKLVVDLLKRLDYARLLYIRSKKRGSDIYGRPYIQDPAFTELMELLKPRLKNMQAYFIYLIRDHAKVSYRRAAHFGSLFLPDMKQCFRVISYAPCEPDRDTRHYAMLMGAPMLRKYLPSRGPADKPITVDPRSKGAKPPYTYAFDSDPYINLLRAPTVEERLYALSFLRILAATRPDQAAEQLRRMGRFVLDGLKSPNKDIAKVTRYVINDLAIATRPLTGIQDDCPLDKDKAATFYQQLLVKLFPDIRIKGGIVELYESPGLREVLDKLVKLCADGQLGFRDSQEIGSKTAKRLIRGLRLREYDLVKSIGLEPGILVTAINGTPVFKPQEIPKLISTMLTARQHAFALTFVDAKGKERVLQYRYKTKQ